MIGQTKLKETINRLAPFPQSVILLGDKGFDYKSIYEFISLKFDLEHIDITNTVTRDTIDELSLCATPTLFTVNLMELGDKEQNILLKIFEEPNIYTYIILYSESLNNVLETIQNRGYILKMDKYSRSELEGLVTNGDKEYILSVCDSPGLIETANHTDMAALKKLCETMLNSMNKASISNALTITNKINFKDEYSKYDLNLFLKVLSSEIIRLGKFKFYEPMRYLYNNIGFMNICKMEFFDRFIMSIWKIARGLNE